jgi:hypothetical protein
MGQELRSALSDAVLFPSGIPPVLALFSMRRTKCMDLEIMEEEHERPFGE